ncbi:hypothetical protein BDB01DRAFT_844946 [Pilobolus umbonatus]|nr:hypothetical protein BDB01DRAFT_844946 [Pilobolus umbonatus]
MTRFWKKASIKEDTDGYRVVLDHRNLRTPDKHVVQFPKHQRELALLTAAEWDIQTRNLKAHSLPLTSIIARAIDALDPKQAQDPSIRAGVIDKLVNYSDTDAICYHEELPESLVALQDTYWKPIIAWAEKEYDVKINTTTDIFATSQPQETKDTFRKVVEQMDPLELSAFEKAVMTSKSFLIGLAVVKKAFSVEDCAQAAQVEMTYQMNIWGEVEDSHDVEREFMRQTLGSAAICVMDK